MTPSDLLGKRITCLAYPSPKVYSPVSPSHVIITSDIKLWEPNLPRGTAKRDPEAKLFVAFLDIMGFENRVLRNSHATISRMMQLLRDSAIDPILDHIKPQKAPTVAKPTPVLQDPFGDTKVTPVLFSDTILLVSSDDSLQAARHIVFCTQWVLKQAFLAGIPIKGAIAHGKFTADFGSSLYFGKPLIDAYHLQDELCLYGVVLHHSMERHLHKINKPQGPFGLLHVHVYRTPMKIANVNHFILGWYPEDMTDPTVNSILTNFYNGVSGATRRYVDNTAEFIMWLKQQTPANSTVSQEQKKVVDS